MTSETIHHAAPSSPELRSVYEEVETIKKQCDFAGSLATKPHEQEH